MKYYIEVEQEATYPDSSCDVFYSDEPLDTVEEAKRRALEEMGKHRGSGQAKIYECKDNVLRPILGYWRHDMSWTDLVTETTT